MIQRSLAEVDPSSSSSSSSSFLSLSIYPSLLLLHHQACSPGRAVSLVPLEARSFRYLPPLPSSLDDDEVDDDVVR